MIYLVSFFLKVAITVPIEKSKKEKIFYGEATYKVCSFYGVIKNILFYAVGLRHENSIECCFFNYYPTY